MGVKTATIANPDRGEPMLASAPVPEIARGGAGLTNIETLGGQTVNLPPAFRSDADHVSVNGRIRQHTFSVYGNLKSGSATEITSTGWIKMFLDRRIKRNEYGPLKLELTTRTVSIVVAYLKFTDDEPPSASFYPAYYGEDTVGFYGILPFSRMSAMQEVVGRYENNHSSMFFDLWVADDDISVRQFYIETFGEEKDEDPAPRRKPRKKN